MSFFSLASSRSLNILSLSFAVSLSDFSISLTLIALVLFLVMQQPNRISDTGVHRFSFIKHNEMVKTTALTHWLHYCSLTRFLGPSPSCLQQFWLVFPSALDHLRSLWYLPGSSWCPLSCPWSHQGIWAAEWTTQHWPVSQCPLASPAHLLRYNTQLNLHFTMCILF